jgi:hypothetical protein
MHPAAPRQADFWWTVLLNGSSDGQWSYYKDYRIGGF